MRDRFLIEYDGRTIEDWGGVVSGDFKSFAHRFRNYIKRNAERYGYCLRKYFTSHYYISGYLEKDGKYVYISYYVPRWGAIDIHARDCTNGVLYCTAESTKDTTGGWNHFTSLEDMFEDINILFNQ